MKRNLLVLAALASVILLAGLVLEPNGYVVRILCIMLLTASMAQAWNVVGGFNQISLGHAAFFGIGAYIPTITQVAYGLSPWLGMGIGIIAAVVLALVLSGPTMRLKGPYFALATLAAAEACRIGASVLKFTGGPQGISVPFVGDSWAMMQFRFPGHYLPLFVLLFLVSCTTFAWLTASRYGYFLRAVRDDEQAAEVAGVATFRVKLLASVISAALTAACGTLFAQFTYFIDPETVFSASHVSIRMALVAIIGGVGTFAGPILGAFLIVPLEEVLNATLSEEVGGLAPLIFGALLIAVVLLRPDGLTSLRLPKVLRRPEA
ncbi:branched-chain amino acid ABC transporter permease [Paroceanicella profunda]|uniref:Branched-chain amino acid ABC transporter permease n=1 Tax=Paroceanicella profunda TaxID=2579971 RepID=A0A5B8G0M3_9RHOB|nr:branched-chain amino acid ABC transporter permease [Paroceanicella profunda]QDL93320.1 branched-chain amino acid ABC transporter permease [Paroceanicella profunda]